MGFCRKGWLRCDDSRFANLGTFLKEKSTRKVCPDRGILPAYQEVPERETFLRSFCFCKKNQKAAGTPSCDLGSKLYGKIFFVAFPAFVPKPVYGTTRFFGGFEPLRKGYCSTDARLMFFENGMPHCKLAEANVFEKGSCSLSLLWCKFKTAVRCLIVSTDNDVE